MEMAESSNALDVSLKLEDLKYLYASNVSNIVSVKLSGNGDYCLWKAQMLCLMESHKLRGLIDDKFVDRTRPSEKNMKPYDNLLKGWIFGSLTQEVLHNVANLGTAKAVWEELQSIFEPDMEQSKSCQIESTYSTNNSIGTEDSVDNDSKKKLFEAAEKGEWNDAKTILSENPDAITVAIDGDGNTVLHIAVLRSHMDFVKNLLKFIKKLKSPNEALKKGSEDGSTPLHIAAMVGNTSAAELLVKENSNLLGIPDCEYKLPLHRAYDNMELATFSNLLKATCDNEKSKKGASHNEKSKKATRDNEEIKSLPLPLKRDHEINLRLLVNVISAKRYDFASQLVKAYPEILDVKTDDVLMAIARNFPSGLNSWQTCIYPSLKDFCAKLIQRSVWVFASLTALYIGAKIILTKMKKLVKKPGMTVWRFMLEEMGMIMLMILLVPAVVLFFIYRVVCLLLTMLFTPFFLLYFLLWKLTSIVVEQLKDLEKENEAHIEAKLILEKLCEQINDLNALDPHHTLYKRPILEAACQNAYEVVDMILSKSPKAFRYTNESGHDIIQLAVIHRSEKIYNMIYQKDVIKNHYSKIVDSSKNNLLHMAGRIAPSHKLNRRIGAALQLQHELQWHEEVKRIVFPSCITDENAFKETPNMVFTREHKDLVKEGGQWMKTTAESCSITATLITTIVFAAAITVPGGNNQETGIPLFTTKIAFNIFAISNAISLFASAVALLLFLSILTARFSEQDFLVRLPRRLIIGLFCLFLSTASMMIAFSAILFLVFCRQRMWIIAPICGLAFLPVVCATLQFSIVIDLILSTYFPVVGKKDTRGKSDPNVLVSLFRDKRNIALPQQLRLP